MGPLYVGHLRRWAEQAASLGCAVYAAGHVRPERRLTDLSTVADRVEVAPERLWELGTARRVAWLRGVIRRLQPDVVHAHWLPTWACYAAVAGGRPVIATPWGSDLYLSGGEERARAERALRRADLVLARSPHMHGALLARGVPPRRVREVDLGVDLDRFRPPSAGERARLRWQLGLPDAGPVVLSFRAGTALYNLDIVLEAFRALRDGVPDATLLVIHGDAPLSRGVRAALHGIDGTDGVRVVGSVAHDEMPAYLRSATAGISIPDSDGSPSSVWEGLASGLPLVLSDLPQITQRIGHSGAVRLVEPRPAEVTSALHDLVTDAQGHDEMSRAARAWAAGNVDRRLEAAKLEGAYGAALDGLTRPAARALPRSRARDTGRAAPAHRRPS